MQPAMSRMNARVKLHGESESAVATGFLQQALKLDVNHRVTDAVAAVPATHR